MSDSIFREGGPYHIRKTGADEYSLRVQIPSDEHGRIARECHEDSCSPGYFKVKTGTGITDEQDVAYCPYCRHSDEPDEFTSSEQLEYLKSIAEQEAHKGIERMLKGALGLGSSGRKVYGNNLMSMEVRFKPGIMPRIHRPVEEELLRAVVCPYCGLDHAVYGLATWCPDCGRDIFMTHVKAECDVIRKMLSDYDNRYANLGSRIAARDVENSLEDTVSIFEAVLKALFIRFQRERGEGMEAIQASMKRRVRNGFQNIRRSAEIVAQELGVPLVTSDEEDSLEVLTAVFEKRHPITHNLGVIDRKYLENAISAEREGREIRVTCNEVVETIDLAYGILKSLHDRLFP